MRAYLIIIFQIRQQHMSEVPLSEHNNVVKAFPSDRTDQPFGVSILPRGAWRRWSVANAHRSKSSDEDIAIGLIAIADQIVGSPFPAEGFRNLICNPFCGRMRCDAEPYDLSSAVPHDQQSIKQTKRDCRHDEQIHRGDAHSGLAMLISWISLRMSVGTVGSATTMSRLPAPIRSETRAMPTDDCI